MILRRPTLMPALLSGALLVAACGGDARQPAATTAADAVKPVVVFASGDTAGISAALDAWRAATGNSYQLLTDDLPPGVRRNPAVKPEADLFVAGSLAEVWTVAEADSLRPVFSERIGANVDVAYRDPESRWVALSRRARIVAYNTGRVEQDALSRVDGYASLADDSWAGQLCVSSSAVPGNRALVAFLISRHGEREAELIVRGWRENLATLVLADDNALLDALADGRCAVGLVDSASLAAFAGANPDAPVAAHWFPDTSGTLTDISAAAVTRHAVQADAAGELLEWLTGSEANAVFAGRRFEFPVNDAAALATAVAAWSGQLPQSSDYAALGFLLEEAELLTERARYP